MNDTNLLECLCPFCEESFYLPEDVLEEETMDLYNAICPVCEEAIPLEEIMGILRRAKERVGDWYATRKAAGMASKRIRQQGKVLSQKKRIADVVAKAETKKAKAGYSQAHGEVARRQKEAEASGDVKTAERLKKKGETLKGREQKRYSDIEAKAGKAKEKASRGVEGLAKHAAAPAPIRKASEHKFVPPDTGAERAVKAVGSAAKVAGSAAKSAGKSAASGLAKAGKWVKKKAKISTEYSPASKYMMSRAAPVRQECIEEAIRLYWDDGESPNSIRRYLYEDLGMPADKINIVMNELGEAIRRFDSDLDSKTVMSILYG